MIRDEMKLNLTDFEKFVDKVELKFGISFYGDLGEGDSIEAYKEETGRDLDYLIGSIDDEDGLPDVTITIGHSFGKRGDEDFMYVVEPSSGSPVYEYGIPSWREAADRTIEEVEKAISLKTESRGRRGRLLKEDETDLADVYYKKHGFVPTDMYDVECWYEETAPCEFDFIQVIARNPVDAEKVARRKTNGKYAKYVAHRNPSYRRYF